MAKESFGLWSPHRNSKSVLAFRSLLKLRPEPWVWLDQAQQASWWVVDGTQDFDAALSRELGQATGVGAVHGILLAPSLSAVRHPEWTFFKVPLQISLVYRWIDTQARLASNTPALFAGQRLQLLRWPNMTRYTQLVGMADGIGFTALCAKLLSGPVLYEDLLGLTPHHQVLQALLRDAQRDGFLVVDATQPRAPAIDVKHLSLLRRLMQKFK